MLMMVYSQKSLPPNISASSVDRKSVFIVIFSRPFVRISGDFSSIFGDFEAKLLSMSIYGFTSY